MITLGGNAELELVDSMDPFAEGIIFSVMPPKKSWRNISNLSGGEKVRSASRTRISHSLRKQTLSSLALVFALHVYKVNAPWPHIVDRRLNSLSSAHAVVLHGRNRCRARLPQRLDRCELHQGSYEERSIHHHLSQVITISVLYFGPTDIVIGTTCSS